MAFGFRQTVSLPFLSFSDPPLIFSDRLPLWRWTQSSVARAVVNETREGDRGKMIRWTVARWPFSGCELKCLIDIFILKTD